MPARATRVAYLSPLLHATETTTPTLAAPVATRLQTYEAGVHPSMPPRRLAVCPLHVHTLLAVNSQIHTHGCGCDGVDGVDPRTCHRHHVPVFMGYRLE